MHCLIIIGQGELVSDIQAGDRITANLFLQCAISVLSYEKVLRCLWPLGKGLSQAIFLSNHLKLKL
jgi:hypothetical protein